MAACRTTSGDVMPLLERFAIVFWFAVVLFIAAWPAYAQPVPATEVPRVAFPLTTSGNVTTFGPLTADAANAKSFSFGVAANGAVFASRSGTMPTPGGASIPVSVTSQIPKANVAAALGRFARKTLPLLSAGAALYDLAGELGYTLDNSAGALVVRRTDPTRCTAAPCYGPVSSRLFNTAIAACTAYAATVANGRAITNLVTYNEASTTFLCDFRAGAQNYSQILGKTSSVPAPSPAQPSTVDEFIASVQSRTTWPESSALARATVDAINSGESLQVAPSAVTGPATSPGPVTTTTDPAAGTTSTSTVTHNYTYNGPNVTVTTTTNNVTTNTSTGAVISTSSASSSPELPKPETPQALCGGPGLPACAVKVDEAGTPAFDPEAIKLDPQIKIDQETQLETVTGDQDKAGLFSDFLTLFTLPPVRECEPLALPQVMSWQMPSLDPCPVVPWVRGLMSLIWAAAGFAFCWGCIREAI